MQFQATLNHLSTPLLITYEGVLPTSFVYYTDLIANS